MINLPITMIKCTNIADRDKLSAALAAINIHPLAPRYRVTIESKTGEKIVLAGDYLDAGRQNIYKNGELTGEECIVLFIMPNREQWSDNIRDVVKQMLSW